MAHVKSVALIGERWDTVGEGEGCGFCELEKVCYVFKGEVVDFKAGFDAVEISTVFVFYTGERKFVNEDGAVDVEVFDGTNAQVEEYL